MARILCGRRGLYRPALRGPAVANRTRRHQRQPGRGAGAARQPRGSQGSVCLQTTIGWLQHRLNQDDLAVATLTSAYRESAMEALSRQRALAAEALSKVMESMGDFDQALDLTRETID